MSNDNPFIEAHFKTLKYRPDYPDRFDSISHARSWMRSFVHWYNHVHYHSGIGYLRPADLHHGRADAIIEHRQATLHAAARTHPERFTKRPTPPEVPTRAWINNLIKRIKRIGFGFRHFANYRTRVLLYCGQPNWDLLATITPR